MISKEQILSSITNPLNAEKLSIEELRHLISLYPSMEILRAIYLRNLFVTNDISFDDELTKNLLWVSNYKWLYNYITYQPAKEAFDYPLPATNDYFAMDEVQQESLKELALKLKAARLAKLEAEKAQKETQKEAQKGDFDEKKVKDLIAQKKYSQALEILRSIDLANSKKNAYFALQIKFLETVVKK